MEYTDKQKKALIALRKFVIKYDVNIFSDDPYCGVEVEIFKDDKENYLNFNINQVNRMISSWDDKYEFSF